MRGQKKQATQLKLDRDRVLSFYLTPEQKELYDQDDYKYLIHLLKIFPTDEFHIIQYILLKFHPLIIKVCRKFYLKKIDMDWMDLISFARYSVVELVLRFDLSSRLYFRTYLPLALDRAVNDYFVYSMRRRGLRNAVRLDTIPSADQDNVLREHANFSNLDIEEQTHPAGAIKDYRDECLHFIESHTEFTIPEKELFLRHFIRHEELEDIIKGNGLGLAKAKRIIQRMLFEVKDHLKENFLW